MDLADRAKLDDLYLRYRNLAAVVSADPLVAIARRDGRLMEHEARWAVALAGAVQAVHDELPAAATARAVESNPDDHGNGPAVREVAAADVERSRSRSPEQTRDTVDREDGRPGPDHSVEAPNARAQEAPTTSGQEEPERWMSPADRELGEEILRLLRARVPVGLSSLEPEDRRAAVLSDPLGLLSAPPPRSWMHHYDPPLPATKVAAFLRTMDLTRDRPPTAAELAPQNLADFATVPVERGIWRQIRGWWCRAGGRSRRGS